MKRMVLLPLIITLALTACKNGDLDQANFTEAELYQGYPCRDYCPAFQKGYDSAIENGITSENDCLGSSIEEVAGCRAFVADFKYENQSFEEFVESL